jgi:hypothetical protein
VASGRKPFEEFREHLSEVLERVLRDREKVVVEVDRREVVTLYPGELEERSSFGKTPEDYEAFLSSFGGWADLDAEAFLRDVYASRDQATRYSHWKPLSSRHQISMLS